MKNVSNRGTFKSLNLRYPAHFPNKTYFSENKSIDVIESYKVIQYRNNIAQKNIVTNFKEKLEFLAGKKVAAYSKI